MPQRPLPRELPHNIEAEQALLGAILINNGALENLSDWLRAQHFYDPLHARIYDTAAKVVEAGRRATPITLKDYFEGEAPVGPISIAQYLGRLISHATSVINAADYATTIRELARRRELIGIGEEIAVTAYAMTVEPPVASQIEAAEARLFQLSDHGRRVEARRLDDVLPEVLKASAQSFASGTALAGLSTGFKPLDDALGGLRPGNLIVLAGRPAMGKSALAEQIALNVAKQGTPALFVSCEMSHGELARRALAAECGISGKLIESGSFDGEVGWRRIHAGAEALRGIPLCIGVE